MPPSPPTRVVASAALLLPALLVAGCATAPAAPAVTSTAQALMDYPYYELEELVADADRIVEGTVVSTSDVVAHPIFKGDDPYLNPLSEASEEEREAASSEGAYATTEVVLDVTGVHKGESPDRLVITQWGGVLDGVLTTSAQQPLLVPGEDYLLFLGEGERPATLSGGAGSYEASDGAFLAMADHAPVASLEREELAILLASDGARAPLAQWRYERGR